MENSTRYLNAFNDIEKYLARYKKEEGYASFSRLVDYAYRKNKIVDHYKYDLKQFAELRNAIVHNSRFSDQKVIAEPHESITAQIESIRDELLKPVLAIDKASKKVVTFHVNDHLNTVLDTIRSSRFTQFPIYEGHTYRGMLTEAGITRWLADQTKIPDTDQVTLDKVLAFENRDRARFAGQEVSLIEVRELFKETNEQNLKIEAVLITDTGDEKGSLIGLITLHDVLNAS